MTSPNEMAALDAALSDIDAHNFAGGLDQLCEAIDKARGPIEAVLPWIEAIAPTVGKLLRVLLQIAKTVCPAR